MGLVKIGGREQIHHPHAVWADRAQFAAPARVQEMDGLIELIPVADVGPNRVLICALPFFVYGYSLGDEVELGPSGYLTRVIKQAPTFTYRVSLDDRDESRLSAAELEPIRKRAIRLQQFLEARKFLVEWHSFSYGAVAANSYLHAEDLTKVLDELEVKGELRYESGA